MFGLESQSSKKKEEPFFFDLENDVKDPNKFAKIREKIQSRLLRIKGLLRTGMAQEDFEHLGHLVYGYTALLKVLSKVNSSKASFKK